MSDNYAELMEVMRAYVDDSDWSRGRDWCEKSVAAIEALVKERDALRAELVLTRAKAETYDLAMAMA